jgi:hypothetical protein
MAHQKRTKACGCRQLPRAAQVRSHSGQDEFNEREQERGRSLAAPIGDTG